MVASILRPSLRLLTLEEAICYLVGTLRGGDLRTPGSSPAGKPSRKQIPRSLQGLQPRGRHGARPPSAVGSPPSEIVRIIHFVVCSCQVWSHSSRSNSRLTDALVSSSAGRALPCPAPPHRRPPPAAADCRPPSFPLPPGGGGRAPPPPPRAPPPPRLFPRSSHAGLLGSPPSRLPAGAVLHPTSPAALTPSEACLSC